MPFPLFALPAFHFPSLLVLSFTPFHFPCTSFPALSVPCFSFISSTVFTSFLPFLYFLSNFPFLLSLPFRLLSFPPLLFPFSLPFPSLAFPFHTCINNQTRCYWEPLPPNHNQFHCRVIGRGITLNTRKADNEGKRINRRGNWWTKRSVKRFTTWTLIGRGMKWIWLVEYLKIRYICVSSLEQPS